MATSGTWTWAPTFDDLLLEAWERLSKSEAELTGAVARSARQSLQLLMLEWTNRGLNLWQVDQQTLSTVIGTVAYTLPAATVEPLDVTVTVGGVERLLSPIGRGAYAAIPIKTTKAPPTQYWANRQASGVTLYLYPAPDAVYAVTYWRMREAQDIGAMANTIDAPKLWADALAAGLAARMAEKFAPERMGEKETMAERAFKQAAGENRNRVPLTIRLRMGRR
jgi:hypothetical protein